MNTEMLSYIKKNSPIHKLTGATKLICFLLWTIAAMITYDTRVLIGLFIAGIIVFKISIFYTLFYIIFLIIKCIIDICVLTISRSRDIRE